MTGDSLRLETGAGVVDITLNGAEIEMTQIAPQFGAMVDPALVAATVGLPKEAIAAPPQSGVDRPAVCDHCAQRSRST